MTVKNCYGATSIGDAAAGALESIDGTDLNEGDSAIVIMPDEFGGSNQSFIWFYSLKDSGAVENIPWIVAPTVAASTKRWHIGKVVTHMDCREFIPVELAGSATSAPDALETILGNTGGATHDERAVKVRKFDYTGSYVGLTFPWTPPPDIDVDYGIRARLHILITESTTPSSQGVVFSIGLQGLEDGDELGPTGNSTDVEFPGMASNPAQFGYLISNVTGNYLDFQGTTPQDSYFPVVLFQVFRKYDHTTDTYDQKVGLVGLEVIYKRLTNLAMG